LTTDFLPGQNVQSAQFTGFSLPVDRVLSPPVVEELLREEQARRQQLEQRVELLAQRLLELGIDPDTIN